VNSVGGSQHRSMCPSAEMMSYCMAGLREMRCQAARARAGRRQRNAWSRATGSRGTGLAGRHGLTITVTLAHHDQDGHQGHPRRCSNGETTGKAVGCCGSEGTIQ
jgi:hypothetical protein